MAFSSNISQVIQRIKDSKAELAETRVKDLSTIANEAIALIRLRVTQGLDETGKPFKPYKPRWSRARKEAGRQTDKVDYTFDGTLLGELISELVQDSEGETTVEIKPRSTQGLAKLGGFAKWRDEFLLRLSEKDINLLVEAYRRRRINRISL